MSFTEKERREVYACVFEIIRFNYSLYVPADKRGEYSHAWAWYARENLADSYYGMSLKNFKNFVLHPILKDIKKGKLPPKTPLEKEQEKEEKKKTEKMMKEMEEEGDEDLKDKSFGDSD